MMKKRLKQLKGIRVSKRQEFVIITLLLTLGLIGTQLVPVHLRFPFVAFLSFGAYLLSAVGLREDLKGAEWVTLLSLPTMFTASLGLFYFLLPVRWLTRVPIAVLYAVGMYAILLVENIYNVAAERSIQLLRVAHAVGFLTTLITLFLLVNTLFSFHVSAFINGAITMVITLPLALQSLWAIELNAKIGKNVMVYTIFFSLMTAQIAFIVSFWPLKPILASLFLTTAFYSLIGIGQQYFAKRLFQKNIMEFIQVFALVLLLILFTTQYR